MQFHDVVQKEALLTSALILLIDNASGLKLMNLLPNSLHACYGTMGNDNSKDYGTVLVSLGRRLGRRRTVRKGHRR